MPGMAKSNPLVYSCSGCSSAAQMANYLAVKLDRTNVAEMSCIVGVGGDVKPLLRTALSGRPIVAIDGCKLHCVKACLDRHKIAPSVHVTLTELGVSKQRRGNFDQDEANAVFERLAAGLADGSLGSP